MAPPDLCHYRDLHASPPFPRLPLFTRSQESQIDARPSTRPTPDLPAPIPTRASAAFAAAPASARAVVHPRPPHAAGTVAVQPRPTRAAGPRRAADAPTTRPHRRRRRRDGASAAYACSRALTRGRRTPDSPAPPPPTCAPTPDLSPPSRAGAAAGFPPAEAGASRGPSAFAPSTTLPLRPLPTPRS
ncbi:hypothetical protein BS78_01G410600 [Paspalum vaginatum]|nr:hypothetical protein BS78_01G410600 [Paspalum vaginatum]